MKNTSKLNIQSLVLVSMLLLSFIGQSIGQQATEGVISRNGRLVFTNDAHLQSVMLSLENQMASFIDNGENTADGVFQDEYPVLESFEKGLSFTSLRNIADQDEFAQIAAGVPSEEIEDKSWIGDPVVESLVNGDYTLQVGNTIVVLYGKGVNLLIENANEAALAEILRGTNPGSINGVTVSTEGGPIPECSADFTFGTSFYLSNSGSFTYSGTPNPAATYYWNFGDGQSSTQQNPAHTYTGPGLYSVCLTITSGGCASTECKFVPVNQGCLAWFKFTKTGAPGLVQFTDQSQATTTITSWAWTFGDGSTSTSQHPTHTYACDGEYQATLEITTTSGCKRKISRKVSVTSYRCCDDDINKVKITVYLPWDNNRRVKIEANDVQIGWPFNIKRVVAESKHSKKGWLGIYWSKKAQQKVSLIGKVYLKDQVGCTCVSPFDIGTTINQNATSVSAKKNVPDKFKTWKDDPWRAKFWVDNKYLTEIIAPVGCN